MTYIHNGILFVQKKNKNYEIFRGKIGMTGDNYVNQNKPDLIPHIFSHIQITNWNSCVVCVHLRVCVCVCVSIDHKNEREQWRKKERNEIHVTWKQGRLWEKEVVIKDETVDTREGYEWGKQVNKNM